MKYTAIFLISAMYAAPSYAELCFDKAGRDNAIDPLLLMAIGIKESRLNAQAINTANRNKSEDVCAMQVNSWHYKELKRFNITRDDLLRNPCMCVYTGSWVLAKIFQQYGKSWNSVGIYNAGPAKKNASIRSKYSNDVKAIYKILLARKIIQDQQTAQNQTYPSNSHEAKPAPFYSQQGIK